MKRGLLFSSISLFRKRFVVFLDYIVEKFNGKWVGMITQFIIIPIMFSAVAESVARESV